MSVVAVKCTKCGWARRCDNSAVNLAIVYHVNCEAASNDHIVLWPEESDDSFSFIDTASLLQAEAYVKGFKNGRVDLRDRLVAAINKLFVERE